VELVEIPTHADANDNIVAFWVPETLPERGMPVSFSYTMYWYGDDPSRPPGGFTVATRRGRPDSDTERFVVDFAGKQLAALSPESVLRALTTVTSGGGESELIEQQVLMRNPVTPGWRLVFQVRPQTGEPVQIRTFLQHKQNTLTETWSYMMER
jgi:glucans biosynthesis protein